MAEPTEDYAHEYREPDASYGDGSKHNASDLICNKCHEILYLGDDQWVCSCDGAYFEYARPRRDDDD